jgi:thiosulfate dehydrogenase (quinone) large subunit
MSRKEIVSQIPEPPLARFLFADTRFAIVWLALRLYVGWIWVVAGWEKIMNPVWVGPKAGVGLAGFANAALEKTAGAHPDVSGWYAMWLKDVVIPNASFFSHIVAYGEFLVGVGLILGMFTGIAAFFGAFMNMNFLFAGAVSVNPIMVVIQLFLILAWRVAGWLGFDRFVLPFLGTPWQAGTAFKKKK